MRASGNGFALPRPGLPLGAAGAMRLPAKPERLTITGMLLGLSCLSIAMSAWAGLRIPIPLLNAHPYLVVMLPLFLYVFFTRITQFPLSALTCMLTFSLLYTLSVLSGQPIYVQEIAKLWAGLVTTITAALAVRNMRDYRAAVIALTTALLIMSAKGLLAPGASYVGVDPLDTGNENSWSLYNLPPLLLAGHLALDRTVRAWVRAFCGFAFVVIAIAVLASANRSGWLGLAMVPPMLFLGRGQKLQTMVFVTLAGVATFVLMERLHMFDIIEHHMSQTTEGKTTDFKRLELFKAALIVGIENPVLGASPQQLYWELGKHVYSVHGFIDSHNVFATIIGGSGYPCMFMLFLAAFFLWKRPGGVPADFFGNQRAASAHYILRMMILLWGVRGFFSREILYSPVFCVGVGICIGWCMIEGVWKTAEQQRAALAGAKLGPAPLPYRTFGMRPTPRRAW